MSSIFNQTPLCKIAFLPQLGRTTTLGMFNGEINIMGFSCPANIQKMDFLFFEVLNPVFLTSVTVGLYDGITRNVIAKTTQSSSTEGVKVAQVSGNLKLGQQLIIAWTHNDATDAVNIRGVDVSAQDTLMAEINDARFSGRIIAGGGANLPDVLPLADASDAFNCPAIIIQQIT